MEDKKVNGSLRVCKGFLFEKYSFSRFVLKIENLMIVVALSHIFHIHWKNDKLLESILYLNQE